MVQCNTTLIVTGGANKETCRGTIYQYLSTFIRIFGRQKMDNKTYFLLQNNLMFATVLPSNLSHSI